jgi:hypothetical protein
MKVRIVLLMAVAAMAFLVLAFGFTVAWLVQGETPRDPGADDR